MHSYEQRILILILILILLSLKTLHSRSTNKHEIEMGNAEINAVWSVYVLYMYVEDSILSGARYYIASCFQFCDLEALELRIAAV